MFGTWKLKKRVGKKSLVALCFMGMRPLLFLLLCLNLAFLTSPALAASNNGKEEESDENSKKNKTVQFYFATTRLNTGNEVSPDYSGQRHLDTGGGSVEYGSAGIYEPENLKSPASAENGKDYKKLLRKDADAWRKARLTFVSKSSEEDFFKRVRDWTGKICIYIHGYDKPFEEAAEDACMVFADYRQYESSPSKKLLPILFTWPSVSGRTEYGTDEANLEWSSLYFDAFMDKIIAEKNPKASLDLVTHSMGGRLIYWYLNRNCKATQTPFMYNLFLCSSDIDFHLFETRKGLFENAVENRVYVFVSDRDTPLILSHYLHEQPRLGRPIDPPKFTRERKTILSSQYLAQLTTDTGDLLAGNDFTEPTDVKNWLVENPALDKELGEKSRFIDVTDLVTKDFGHAAAFSVIAAYMAGQPIPQLTAQLMHKRPDRTTLKQNGGKPAYLYRFLRLQPFNF